MGNCISPNGKKKCSNSLAKKCTDMKEMEVQLLQLMFKDLAQRSRSRLLTRENFEIFFHMSGLWGQEIFTRFDTKKVGRLDFEDFRRGIQYLVKGDFEQRVHALFEFYNIHKTNGISYEELLKMLYSYPKQELKKVIDDQKFLNAMNPQERHYHFGKSRVLDDAREVVEEVEEQSSSEGDCWKREKMVSAMPRDLVQVKAPQLTLQRSSNKSNSQRTSATQRTSGSMLFAANEQPLKKGDSRAKRSGSISYFEPLQKKNFKVSSNISLVVKKYATFLFKQFKLDKEKDELSEQQFVTLVQKHSKIFKSYYEGFHNYVWEVNTHEIPLSKMEDCWIESHCQQVDFEASTSNRRFIRFVRTTLFVYQKASDSMPVEIKNLQGLLVEEFNRGTGDWSKGFIVKHRDGLYPEKAFLFESTYQQEEWLKHLKHFKNSSIYDIYQLQERIGAGNFSVVYKGCEKPTKKEVAVKVIQKFKLNEGEQEVIKHQCNILGLCHHPCIIKYINKIQSKTHIFIVTEYMSEGVLYEYVKEKGFLEEYEASLIMKQLIETVIYLNSLSLIHRDIKAENIMIRLNKQKNMVEKVKIIDFGFAVFQESLKNMKAAEKFAGTPGYLAPEILRFEEYDETVDNFSLGVILYFMLSGILPFHNVIHEQVVNLTLRCCVTYTNTHWTNISENGRDLLSKLLCPREQRVSLEDAIKHPWITERQELTSFIGKNKRKPKRL